MDNLLHLFNKPKPSHTPYITLSFAQSIDGSIGTMKRQPVELSSLESLQMTHHLRNSRDAVIVGIGTVRADNPNLTVRLVEYEKQPIAVVVDPNLDIPLECNLMQRNPVLCCIGGMKERKEMFERKGARVLECGGEQGHVDLRQMVHLLWELGIRSMMIEGGSSILTSFVERYWDIVDEVVITICPLLLGGLKPFHGLESPRILQNAFFTNLGRDTILYYCKDFE